MERLQTVALIVAGGKGTRARIGQPKQYAHVGGVPLLRRTVAAFTAHPKIDAVRVVIGEDDRDLYEAAVAGLEKLLPPVTGGAERQSSVFNGLRSLTDVAPEQVLIHDGARPFVAAGTITNVLDALQTAPGAIAALPVSDTLKKTDSAGGIERTVDREGLWRAQTPQGFRYETIWAAHQDAEPNTATDDASLLEGRDQHVALVPDEPTNIKLTYKEDFALAEMLLAANSETRVGYGYDVHAFEDGDRVILGGIEIPHTHKLKGHSDADAALHALTDALYGTIGAGDIGLHFPPSDEQWRGAPSDVFLRHAAEMVRAKGGEIVNCDITIICEAPKIGPHRERIEASITEILGLSEGRVSVKATTTEKLGFAGRREGLAAQAVATVRLVNTP